MGPPPRSLAAEANDCFMVRAMQGSTEYKVAGAWRAQSGLPSDDDDERRVEEKDDAKKKHLDQKIPIQG